MKQLETLGFETDELPERLVEATADQLARDAESIALKDLGKYAVPFGVELAEKVPSTEINNVTNTITGERKTGVPGNWDSTSDNVLDR
jgi:hypothetical protein